MQLQLERKKKIRAEWEICRHANKKIAIIMNKCSFQWLSHDLRTSSPSPFKATQAQATTFILQMRNLRLREVNSGRTACDSGCGPDTQPWALPGKCCSITVLPTVPVLHRVMQWLGSCRRRINDPGEKPSLAFGPAEKCCVTPFLIRQLRRHHKVREEAI